MCLISGNTATRSYTRRNAKIAHSGDYFCVAKVGESEDDRETSHGVPIQVIKGTYLRCIPVHIQKRLMQVMNFDESSSYGSLLAS